MTSSNAVTLAVSAALLALSAGAFAADAPQGSTGKAIGATDGVHCYGVHACKGNSDCKTTDHSCKGMNSCKGQGFKAMPAGACLMKKGVIGDIAG